MGEINELTFFEWSTCVKLGHVTLLLGRLLLCVCGMIFLV